MHLVHSLLCEHFRISRRRRRDVTDEDDDESSDEDDSEDDSKSFYADVDVLLDSSSSSSSKYSDSKKKRIAKGKGVGAWLVSGSKGKIDPRNRKATKLANAVVLPEPRLGIDQGDRRSGAFFKKKKQNDEDVVDNTQSHQDLGQHGHLMVQFGVSLLHTFVRKGRVSKSEQEHLEMMDPMIALLTLSAKKARNDEILLASLRCITAVVTWPLPSILKYANTITSIVFKVLVQFGSATADLAQGCFKTLTKILQSKNWNAKPNELKVLITLLERSIEIPQKQKSSFELVQALIAAKIVNAQIYGLMDTLQNLLLESQHDFVRRSSSQILVRYLLTYPLSSKRLLAHLNFF